MSGFGRLVHAYLRAAAGLTRDAVPAGGFTAFLHRHDPLRYLSFAIPDDDAVEFDLDALAAAFVERGRTPRVELVPEAAPEAAAALDAAWRLDGRHPLMACSPEELEEPAAPEGLAVTLLGPGSPDDDLRAYLAVQRAAYSDARVVGEDEIARLRESRAINGLARLGTEPVGIASVPAIVDGLAELAGVGTVPERRRLGVAGALTAAVTQEAFRRGATLAFLTAESQRAGSVYARAGYRLRGEARAYEADS